MLERFLVKNYLNFKDLELKFKPGLSVFTGSSGSGKSLLMRAIMGVFGIKDCEAKLIEADVGFEFKKAFEFGIESEDINVFKLLKDRSSRYFLNSQSISKKNLIQISNEYISYLSSKLDGDFDNENFINLLDKIEIRKNKNYEDILNDFLSNFKQLNILKQDLLSIKTEENKINDLIEFAKFEIEKIQRISPKKGELENLLNLKKRLSQREKIINAWQNVQGVFDIETDVIKALNLSEVDGSFFSDAISQLLAIRDNIINEDFSDIDIEATLNRIEELNDLCRRYGSEEESLKVLDKREQELLHYENLSFEKKELEKNIEYLFDKCRNLAFSLSKFRNKNLKILEDKINYFLDKLYMHNINLQINETKLSVFGFDEIILNPEPKNLSSGELNRLRLAFMAAKTELLQDGQGIIILDEIDANLSGKEAMSIANVLLLLSKFYQIFAISHQPQLSAKAHNHFLVYKKDGISYVKELFEEDRINECARMISGENISKQALEFAKQLINNLEKK